MNLHTMPYTSTDLVNLYQNTSSGHYFDKETMRFFKSRVTSNFRRLDDTNALFITTECGPAPGSKRLATIRHAKIVEYVREGDGRICQRIEIKSVGTFNIMTLYYAKQVMQSIPLHALKTEE